MPLRATAPAPTEADLHAPPALPGAVEAWLCALLTALLWHLEPIAHRIPGTRSHPTPDLGAELDSHQRAYIRAVLRRANRIRAWIGWILRFKPGRGMRPTFASRTPAPPLRPPRAPPLPA